MMQSVALESNIIMNEDADYIFIQPEDMDIDDEASYDDCDEAITFPSSSSFQGLSMSHFRGTFKEPTSQNVIQSEFAPEIESSASVVSLENDLLQGKDNNETLSLEGSTTLFTDETLPSLDEVDVQMENTDSSSGISENEMFPSKTTEIIILKSNDKVVEQDLPVSLGTLKNVNDTMTLEENGEDCHEKNSGSTMSAVKAEDKFKEDIQRFTIKTVNESTETTMSKSQASKSRLSNKKRRKQMKKQKKAKAAEVAANALSQMRSQLNDTPSTEVKSKTASSSSSKPTSKSSRTTKSRKGDKGNIAVACATESLIAYRQQHNIKKKPDTINYVAFL
jgi:hypothetical protein